MTEQQTYQFKGVSMKREKTASNKEPYSVHIYHDPEHPTTDAHVIECARLVKLGCSLMEEQPGDRPDYLADYARAMANLRAEGG